MCVYVHVGMYPYVFVNARTGAGAGETVVFGQRLCLFAVDISLSRWWWFGLVASGTDSSSTSLKTLCEEIVIMHGDNSERF